MKCSTCKCGYICDLIRIFKTVFFLVVRSDIQTQEQNIQIGRKTEAGKIIVLGRPEKCE